MIRVKTTVIMLTLTQLPAILIAPFSYLFVTVLSHSKAAEPFSTTEAFAPNY